MSLVVRALVALLVLGFVASPASAAPPEISVAPALPAGWMTTTEFPVVVTATSAVNVVMLGAYAGARELPQFRCGLLPEPACAQFASLAYTVRPLRLSDGIHELVVTATDANSETSVRRLEFRVDHTSPDPVAGLAVDRGEGWRSLNRYAVNWTASAGDAGSPVVAVRYDLCPADGSFGCLSGRQNGSDLTALGDIHVPGSGVWRLRVALEDEAGNVDLEHAAATTLRLDTEPPELAFSPRDPQDPARIRLEATDSGSGVADVSIEARRRGEVGWRSLPVDRGQRITALLDDDVLPAGTYEIRGRAVDVVGNERSVSTWRTGGTVEVTLPVRQGSRISAGMRAKDAKGRTKLASRPLLAFGSVTTLHGALTDDAGRGRGGVPVVVSERLVTPGSPWRTLRTVMTDKSGGMLFRVASGPARTIRFAYAGTPTTRAATADVLLRVRARTTLTANRRRLQNGDTIELRGTLAGEAIPPAGKLVTLQAKIPSGWRTFGTARARAKDGRWIYPYTFTRTPTTARYTFRAVVPTETAFPYVTGVSARLRVVVSGAS